MIPYKNENEPEQNEQLKNATNKKDNIEIGQSVCDVWAIQWFV